MPTTLMMHILSVENYFNQFCHHYCHQLCWHQLFFPFFRRNRDHIFIISCGNHLKVHKSKIVVVVVFSVQNPSESIIMDGIVRIEFVKSIPINRKNVILNSFLANVKQFIWIFHCFVSRYLVLFL